MVISNAIQTAEAVLILGKDNFGIDSKGHLCVNEHKETNVKPMSMQEQVGAMANSSFADLELERTLQRANFLEEQKKFEKEEQKRMKLQK